MCLYPSTNRQTKPLFLVLVLLLCCFLGSAQAQDARYPRCQDAKEAGKAKSPGMWKVPCWLEVSNQPKCGVLILQSDTRKVVWDGACVSSAAQGTGVFRRMPHRFRAYMTEESGAMVSGKRHGPWVVRSLITDPYFTSRPGEVAEGSYVDGLAQGRWVHRWNAAEKLGFSRIAGTSEGSMADGRKHGPWVTRSNDGDIVQGSYVNGKEQGLWVARWGDGTGWKGSYVDGKRHGHWVEEHSRGEVEEGSYMDGKRHGPWVIRSSGGSRSEGHYVDGKKDGRWTHWSRGKKYVDICSSDHGGFCKPAPNQ